jgi:hypothetical protein
MPLHRWSLDEFEANIVGTNHECNTDPRWHLQWPFDQLRTKRFEARDISRDVFAVEAEMLEPEMHAAISGPWRFTRACARNVDAHGAVFADATNEPIAEMTEVIADNLELECRNPPLDCLSRIGRFEMNVIDAKRHGAALQATCYVTPE